MCASTPVRKGTRGAASSWKLKVISISDLAWMDSQLSNSQWGGRNWLCYKHPPVSCQILIYARLLFSLSTLLLPTFPLTPCCAVYVHRNKPGAVAATFYEPLACTESSGVRL